MNRKLYIPIILMFLLMGSVSAYYGDLYDEVDGDYILKDPHDDYFSDNVTYDYLLEDDYDDEKYFYETLNPNQIVIDFYGDSNNTISIYVPDNDYYLQNDIHKCIDNQINDLNANVTTLKNEISNICMKHGIDNPDITFKSPYGNNSFLFSSEARGISMEPTINHRDTLILNKTHDFEVGDIVSAIYPYEHNGYILKRVAVIDGDEVYLVSDNVNGTYVKYGKEYEYEGLRTWVNMSDIRGVLVDNFRDESRYLYYDDYI